MTSHSKRAKAHSTAPLRKADVRNIFYGLMLAMFLSALNQTIVATALPTIGREFGDFENLSWVIIAYLLSSTVVSPLYGKLSDIHGRRAMMLVAIGLFIAGSAASAAAPNMALLIAGRTLQGIGGGGIVPLVQTTIAEWSRRASAGATRPTWERPGSWPGSAARRWGAASPTTCTGR